MPPSLRRLAPAAAMVGFVVVVVLLKWWVDRGPGPLDWRDGEGKRPERVNLETEKATGDLPEAFSSPDLQRTEGG